MLSYVIKLMFFKRYENARTRKTWGLTQPNSDDRDLGSRVKVVKLERNKNNDKNNNKSSVLIVLGSA